MFGNSPFSGQFRPQPRNMGKCFSQPDPTRCNFSVASSMRRASKSAKFADLDFSARAGQLGRGGNFILRSGFARSRVFSYRPARFSFLFPLWRPRGVVPAKPPLGAFQRRGVEGRGYRSRSNTDRRGDRRGDRTPIEGRSKAMEGRSNPTNLPFLHGLFSEKCGDIFGGSDGTPKLPTWLTPSARRLKTLAMFGPGPRSAPTPKLLVSWLLGSRDTSAAVAFVSDLLGRLKNRVQLTSKGCLLPHFRVS